MSEKRWTDDERDEAFDRGMETMQRVALELYRRGREPLLEELEEARARNADMRAMLEQVTRERDEARAEVERQRELKDYLRTWLSSEELECLRVKAAEHPLLWEEIHHLKDEVERLRAEAAPTNEHFNAGYRDGYRDAYRRGAEAMREACARMEPYAYNLDDHLMISKWRSLVRGLPIPEDK